MSKRVNILVTLDKNYLFPLKVMLTSLFLNNRDTLFDVYVMHDSLTINHIKEVTLVASKFNAKIINLKINQNEFKDAPTLLHYTKAMYFRLLAHLYLPKTIDKIIYVDPDILVLNRVDELYDTNLKNYYYGAAYHKLFSSKTLNKIRLYPYKIKNYYNSGVLLMNLKKLRSKVNPEMIYDFVNENKAKLVMPDQDVLNSLFAKNILLIDEYKYNYDARHYQVYKALSKGKFDVTEVINQTVFLHFCGKSKPWLKNYRGKFEQLYQHYIKQLKQII